MCTAYVKYKNDYNKGSNTLVVIQLAVESLGGGGGKILAISTEHKWTLTIIAMVNFVNISFSCLTG